MGFVIALTCWSAAVVLFLLGKPLFAVFDRNKLGNWIRWPAAIVLIALPIALFLGGCIVLALYYGEPATYESLHKIPATA